MRTWVLFVSWSLTIIDVPSEIYVLPKYMSEWSLSHFSDCPTSVVLWAFITPVKQSCTSHDVPLFYLHHCICLASRVILLSLLTSNTASFARHTLISLTGYTMHILIIISLFFCCCTRSCCLSFSSWYNARVPLTARYFFACEFVNLAHSLRSCDK